MSLSVDLNADMGESFGPWKMGDDGALLKVVTSANVACGWHAGDANIMAQTMAMAKQNNINIGAHPGFADLQGFGRRRIKLDDRELANLVTYQLGAALAIARAQGGQIHHLKLHGALANMCSEDESMARVCYEAALSVAPEIIIMAMATTAQERAVRSLGCNWVGEIFADRAYEDTGLLVDRSKAGAMIHDVEKAAARIITMVQEQAILTASGKRLPTRVDTVCLHGDGPKAVEMARELRKRLTDAGVTIRPF